MEKIDKIIYNAVKGIKKPSKKDMEYFDKWYEKEFGNSKEFNYNDLKCKVKYGWLKIIEKEQSISVGKVDGMRFKTLRDAVKFVEETE